MELHTHKLHDYLNEIQNSTTLELQLTDEEFEALHVTHVRNDEVNEAAALYVVR